MTSSKRATPLLPVAVAFAIGLAVATLSQAFAVASTPAAGTATLSGAALLPAATATLPLRWRVALVVHQIEANAIKCVTSFVVQNITGASVAVEVEIFSDAGVQTVLVADTIAAGAIYSLGTSTIPELPQTGTTQFIGYANVHADDPRVLASTLYVCPGSDAISWTPTFGVGTTLELFKASLPDTDGRLGGTLTAGQ